MYENLNGNGHAHAISGWKADLHDYARWEYGTEDAAAWLFSEARRHRAPRTSLVGRFLTWLAAPSLPATRSVVARENRGR